MEERENASVDLREEDARYVDELISSGAYGSAAEAIGAGLSALREARRQQWIDDEIAPAYERAKADPSRLIPAEQVFANLRARHEARWAKSRK